MCLVGSWGLGSSSSVPLKPMLCLKSFATFMNLHALRNAVFKRGVYSLPQLIVCKASAEAWCCWAPVARAIAAGRGRWSAATEPEPMQHRTQNGVAQAQVSLRTPFEPSAAN
jgi:hypothetical protein